ncbi:MAG TPA: transporter [Vicinamibacteria bacterium]|nr:transporter [Vicinamibacteria bacterium]
MTCRPRRGYRLPVSGGARAALTAFLVTSVTAPAIAQTRPLLTEEATTAPAGRIVLEAGADAVRAEPNFLTGHARDRYDLPVLRLVFSPAGNVEVDVEWVGRVMARNDPDFGNVSDFGDVTLRAKVRLVEERAGRPALAARFGVTLPETSFGNGLGPNTLRMAAQILLTKTVGGLALHANAGLGLQDEVLRPHEQRDFLVYGVAAVHELGQGVALAAEVAGRAGKGAPGAEARAEARAGVRLGRGRLRADAAARRGLAAADGTWGLTAGLTWVMRSER